jgi:formylglycine-generating enzyme required for sulfatase activity
VRAGRILIAAALALAACRREAPAPAAAPAAAAPAGVVSVSGDDALAQVLSWSLPAVEVAPDEVADARRRARRALAAGDLFETEDSAIPLLFALRRAAPDDERIAADLAEARAALVAQGEAALAAGDADIQALRAAQRRGAVLRKLWPQDPAVVAYLEALSRGERAWDRNARGEALLAQGRLGEAGDAGGALGAFGEALALRPESPRALRGVAAVEAALVARAEAAARRGDFDEAQRQLAFAATVRHDPGTIPAALRRIEAIRGERVRWLRDQGLIALGDPNGLDTARARLAEMLRIADPGDPASIELRRRIDLVSHYGLFRPGQVFTDGMRDGSRGPELVVVPHGGFQMGAAPDDPDATDAERPRHYVRLERGFAMTRTEVSVGQFRRFVAATGYEPRATQRGHSIAYDVRSGNFVRGSGIDWRSGYDGRRAGDGMPVIHVTARDAEAYAAWLSEHTGAHYRLPSEAEFEYALRAGGQGRYPWGDAPAPPAGTGNLTGARDVSPQGRHWSNAFAGYGDGWWGPAPVGSFAPNAYGLHDMAGNVSEWVADCWHVGYRRAPATGAAWINPGCRDRMYRGGAWSSAPAQVRSSWRAYGGVDATNARIGFRLVRQL